MQILNEIRQHKVRYSYKLSNDCFILSNNSSVTFGDSSAVATQLPYTKGAFGLCEFLFNCVYFKSDKITSYQMIVLC